MAKNSFKRVILVDNRKSTPDWEPYKQPNAPAGAAHVESKLPGAHHA